MCQHWPGKLLDVIGSDKIESVEKYKGSGRIVLRVKPEQGPPPALLREAVYNQFHSPVWSAFRREFKRLIVEPDDTTWLLVTNQPASRWVRIIELLPGGKGLLPLPQATAELHDLPVFILEANRLGLVRSIEGPGYIQFRARFGKGFALEDGPDEDDKTVPAKEGYALTNIMEDLNLEAKTPSETILALHLFFNEQFEYSLETIRRPGTNHTPLSYFLLEAKKGHCEYFATATVLLLRAAGIPARYAAGYSVQERKGLEYIVRERHAHAWCLAWIDGTWREVDTTPASWAQLEQGLASWWQPIGDLWSGWRFAFSKWRWTESHLRKYVIWFILLLLPIFALQLLYSRQWRRARRARPILPSTPPAGLESEFYQIEQRVARLGYPRAGSETFCAWLERLRSTAHPQFTGLEPLLRYHYRIRFDPAGLTSPERAALRDQVRDWLEKLELNR